MLYMAQVTDHYDDPWHYANRHECRPFTGIGWGKTPRKALQRALMDKAKEYNRDPDGCEHHLVLVTKIIYKQGREFLNLGD